MLAKSEFTIHKHALFSHSLFFISGTLPPVACARIEMRFGTEQWAALNIRGKMLKPFIVLPVHLKFVGLLLASCFFSLSYSHQMETAEKKSTEHRKAEKQIIYWRDYSIQVAWITIPIVALRKQWEC